MAKKIDYPKTLMTDSETNEKLKELSSSSGLAQALIFRRLVSAAHKRFASEGGAFLLAD